MNPLDCDCEHVHASHPLCRSLIPSRGAVPEAERTFPVTPLLKVELVPATSWFANARTELSKGEWEACKRYVRQRSGDRCEICGGRGRRWPVECHEVWEYDDARFIQRLRELIALCPLCHQVKHFGLSEARGLAEPTMAHLLTVNGWTPEQGMEHLESAFIAWGARSEHQWTIDLSVLQQILTSVAV